MLGQLAHIDPTWRAASPPGSAIKGRSTPVPAAKPTRTDLPPSPPLSILAKAKPTLKGRVVGCLVSDGADAALVKELAAAAKAAGAKMKIVAPRIGGVSRRRTAPRSRPTSSSPAVLPCCSTRWRSWSRRGRPAARQRGGGGRLRARRLRPSQGHRPYAGCEGPARQGGVRQRLRRDLARPSPRRSSPRQATAASGRASPRSARPTDPLLPLPLGGRGPG